MATEYEPSEAVSIHNPCPDCGSSDALAEYPDGGTHCFACGKASDGGSTSSTPKKSSNTDLPLITRPTGMRQEAIPSRKLTLATIKFWDYLRKGNSEYACYYDRHGNLVGMKKRGDGKKFAWKGKPDPKAPLWGQHLWSNQRGKFIVITEGEIDAMSVSQAFANKWPVVSLSGGVQSAKKNVTAALPYLTHFEKVILWFDNDEPGQEASEAVASILPPGKAYIVKSTYKDANEMLVAKGGKEVADSVWAAEPYSPGGLITLDDMINNDMLEPPTMGIPWSKEFLTSWTYGRRYGEVYTFGAGTGVGKSDFLLEEMAFTLGPKVKEDVALFSFETGPSVTARQILGKMVGARLHKPDSSVDDLNNAKKYYFEECATLHVNDLRGTAEWEDIKSITRFQVHAQGIKHVVYDNLTALADPTREKESLEIIMREGASLAEELNVCVYFVSHLTTPESGSHEEGARVTIRQFKGSRSIGFWSFFMFGMERDQQSGEGNTTFRCLKDRFTGEATGKTAELIYNQETGLYKVADIMDKVFDAAEDHNPEEMPY